MLSVWMKTEPISRLYCCRFQPHFHCEIKVTFQWLRTRIQLQSFQCGVTNVAAQPISSEGCCFYLFCCTSYPFSYSCCLEFACFFSNCVFFKWWVWFDWFFSPFFFLFYTYLLPDWGNTNPVLNYSKWSSLLLKVAFPHMNPVRCVFHREQMQ